MVAAAWIAGAAVLLLATGAELLHARRTRVVAPLAFGPTRRPSPWARLAPALQVAAWSGLTWSLVTLFLLPPMRHSNEEGAKHDGPPEHVLLVLDVSPSMRLEDAGPEKKLSRMRRARDLMESFFSRIPMERYRVSVVAVYNGAMPVVVDTADVEVVRNILGDLPMHYAFRSGSTRLFDGLDEAARTAKPWAPRSTTLIVLSDGDTVPASGMPRMPASIGNVLVVGVGDPVTGKFIDGRQSRQDVSTLRQLALRLSGHFHNGNEKHLPTSLIAGILAAGEGSPLQRLTTREYALLVCGIAAALLAALPWLLREWGTRWLPGVEAPAAAAGGKAGRLPPSMSGRLPPSMPEPLPPSIRGRTARRVLGWRPPPPELSSRADGMSKESA